MPPPTLLNAVILAVKHERGYGVFVGPVLCEAWAIFATSASVPSKMLLVFSFNGPNDTPWQGVFASFAYQGRVKRKKNDTHFLIEVLSHAHTPFFELLAYYLYSHSLHRCFMASVCKLNVTMRLLFLW